jgi:hypothetical protein
VKQKQVATLSFLFQVFFVLNKQKLSQKDRKITFFRARTGLPDFARSKHTKTGKNVPNDHKIYQMASKYIK